MITPLLEERNKLAAFALEVVQALGPGHWVTTRARELGLLDAGYMFTDLLRERAAPPQDGWQQQAVDVLRKTANVTHAVTVQYRLAGYRPLLNSMNPAEHLLAQADEALDAARALPAPPGDPAGAGGPPASKQQDGAAVDPSTSAKGGL